MADVFGNVVLPVDSTNETVIYTCPLVADSIDVTAAGQDAEDVVTFVQQAVTQTLVTSLIISSIDTGTQCRIMITPVNTAPSTLGTQTDYALLYNYVATGSTTEVYSGIVLAPGNTLWVDANVADKVTVSCFYIETT